MSEGTVLVKVEDWFAAETIQRAAIEGQKPRDQWPTPHTEIVFSESCTIVMTLAHQIAIQEEMDRRGVEMGDEYMEVPEREAEMIDQWTGRKP